jgi:ketosteroid isomerase-like protein
VVSAQFLARLLAFPLVISEIAGEDLTVHDFGTVAVLTGVQVARVVLPDGSARRSRVMLSTVFGQEAGRWLMLLSYAVELVENI